MGLFLQTAVIPDCKEAQARAAVERLAAQEAGSAQKEYGLNAQECRYKEHGSGVGILFNENCTGYEELACALSKEVGKPVLLAYIYDEDFWGYFLCENGCQVDCFNPMPDYFEEADAAEEKRQNGDAALLAEYFGVDEAAVSRYLVQWTEEALEEEDDSKAYEEDEFGRFDCWQMADFLAKLGCPYEF